jgi:LmbE family N-acetylglucosaminyl deacetylase
MHIYLSPHLDDAVLSCGGRIWQQARAGERVLVVTAFAASPAPDAALSPFANAFHTLWGNEPDAPARRRDEDLAALTYLGAEADHWPYTDCIYRHTPDGLFPYDSEEALFGEVHTSDNDLITELARRLCALSSKKACSLYTPLGIGNHVDHQIVRLAAEASGQPLIYYEDFPYTADPDMRQAVLNEERWRAQVVALSEEALQARIAAISCYDSQLAALNWADADTMAIAVRAYAHIVGEGEWAERYWKPITSPEPEG